MMGWTRWGLFVPGGGSCHSIGPVGRQNRSVGGGKCLKRRPRPPARLCGQNLGYVVPVDTVRPVGRRRPSSPSVGDGSIVVAADDSALRLGVVQRMTENSRSCKVWCVTLVAATLVMVALTGQQQHAVVALVPTLL